MYIISKYKDYYDYLMGINGIDKKVVLDRRKGFIVDKPMIEQSIYHKEKSYEVVSVAICGTLYRGLRDNFWYYWGEEMKGCGEYKKEWHSTEHFIYYSAEHSKWKHSVKVEFLPTKINDEENCPVVFVSGNKDIGRKLFPRLKDIEIPRVYPADKIYLDIYNWISSRNEKPIIDNRTDIEKIENAGFDKITSFRNIK